MIQLLAHAGVEHTTAADGPNWPVIVAVTSVIVISALIAAKLLSPKEKTK